jgi:hypothetical protein
MRVAKLKETYPTAKVELWCEDEHRRLGLKPIIRKAWRSPIGEKRPLVKVHQRYQWTYLYAAFAHPKPERFTGSSYPLLSTRRCSRWRWRTSPGKWERASGNASGL